MRDNSKSHFPGASGSAFTPELRFHDDRSVMPTYRVLDTDGRVVEGADDPGLPVETMLRMYRNMIALNVMDTIMYDAQRQGRISFYMTNYGEEGTHMGVAEALQPQDVIFGQYREAGVLLHRGFTWTEFMSQLFANDLDGGKGRQMPVHYGSRRLNFQTISSPLSTQLPQAAGAAYALKRTRRNAVVCVFFGEGAASEGDFHSAMNIAATTDAPCIFFCRNNGFAISTPAKDQYRGDGIAARAHGYGIPAIRVDGNDVLAVHNASRAARELVLRESRPVLIEAMTYRVGHHSTSDDSSAYRSKREVEAWKRYDSPAVRFRQYLELEPRSAWNEGLETSWRAEVRAELLAAFTEAEKRPRPPIEFLFEDVFDRVEGRLAEEMKENADLAARHPEFYNVAKHATKEAAMKSRAELGYTR
ncbi:thiamine diphosphate-binding protein [Hyaloraphidium curvatum]|nr:thiamine diphosphate-binding protein [Hyaloraphidium curvatum]